MDKIAGKRTHKLVWVAMVAALSVFLFPPYSICDTNPHRFDAHLRSSWYGAYLQGTKVGYMRCGLERVEYPIPGWRMRSTITMQLKMGGQDGRTTIEDDRFFRSPDGELYSNQLIIASPTGEISVSGKLKNGKFVVTTSIGGRESEKSFDVPVDTLDNILRLESYIGSGEVKVGDQFNISSFEPTPPLTRKLVQQVKVIEKQKAFLNGVATDIYLVNIFEPELNLTTSARFDSSGNMLESTIGAGMVIKMESEEQAKELTNDFDILANGLVIPLGSVEKESSSGRLKIRVTGIDKSDILVTDYQKVRPDGQGGLLVQTRKQPIPQRPLPLPVNLRDLRPYLLPGPYEQSDDPDIIDLAKKIVGNEKNSWEAARKINTWVYKNIEKRFTPDISNALQTLRSRRGDCGEHTALAVALLRAAGIPARSVIGLVYWPPGKGFGYHAWTEVFVGQWIQMDPSLGEDLANPLRLGLAYGNDLKMFGTLSRVLGKVKIQVIHDTDILEGQ